MENLITLNAPKKNDLFKVDPRSITADPSKNPRADYGNDDEWNELKESIRENGVKVALKVKTSGATEQGVPTYELIHGFRRHRAVLELMAEGHDIARIPVVTVPLTYSEADAIFDHFIENSGKKFNVLELAELFNRLSNAGYTDGEIEKRTGYSHGNVSQIKALSTTPQRFKDLISDGRISASLVVDTLRTHNGDANKVDAILRPLLETKKGRITRKDLGSAAPRPFIQQKRWTKVVDNLRSRGVDDESLTKVNDLTQKLIDLLYDDTPKAAEKILELVCPGYVIPEIPPVQEAPAEETAEATAEEQPQ